MGAWIGLVCLSVVATSLSACGAGPEAQREDRKRYNQVILNVGGTPKTLDPGLSEDTVSSRAIMPFIRGLTHLDGDGEPHPDIAERWTVSDDGRVYDFFLRDTKWSNGESVTAGDFAYAWLDRLLNPEFASTYAYILFYIEGAEDYYEGKLTDRSRVGIEVVDPKHLRVRFSAPAPFFLQLAAHTSYRPVCESAVRANPDWALRAKTYVSNGPFKLTTLSIGEEITGVRNEGYWNSANVAMNMLTFRCIQEETTERFAFDNGELDGTYVAPRPDLEELERNGTLRHAATYGTYYLNINMKRPQFADPRVRKALALAIDRAAIVAYVSRAKERPAFALVPPELYSSPPEPYFGDARFDEARRLMAEAGYPNGEGFPEVHYLYNTQENHKAIAQVIQETWRKELGIDMVIENQEFRVVIENRHQGNFDIARNGWIADFADPMNFLALLHSESGNNDCQWGDPKYDDFLDRARIEADPEKRMDLLHQAEDYLMEVLPFIPIYNYAQPYLCAPDLEGYRVSPMMTIDVSKLRWSQG